MSIRCLGSVLIAMILAATAPMAFGMTQVEDGVYRVDPKQPDAVLDLVSRPEVLVLVVDQKDAQNLVSDVHMRAVREWVKKGGVLWAVEDGLQHAIPMNIARYRVSEFDYRKSSTGKAGGELIVRDVSPRLVIGDHPLTEGVDKLYLFVRRSFGGSDDLETLVSMTDSRGNYGMVLGVVPVGDGFVVLDGTVRSKKAFAWMPGVGLKGFSEKHPNSLKQGKNWNSYDWPRLMENAKQLALDARAAREAQDRARSN